MSRYCCQLTWLLPMLLTLTEVTAAEFTIGPGDDALSVVKKVQAGDTILLSDGQWIDAELKFERLQGEPDAPITIRAATSGGVVFSGSTRFRVSGNHIVVSGLIFRDCDESDPCELRTHSERLCENCRITDCVFEQTDGFDAKKDSRWLSIYGKRNRIDHCYFAGKKSRGTTLVVWVNDQPQHHRIDHNYFGPRPVLGRNGGETIRIGTSEVSELDSNTTVEDNYFFGCDGEAEVVSNKSCGNIYRHNVFVECAGALTLRHGHRCFVDGNVFLGRTKNQTGGVRIIGSSHVITNNYFDGLRGDAERAAISMMNAVEDGQLSEYAAVTDATVAHNTFVDCKVSLELGVGAGKKQSVSPSNCRITHNIFVPDKWQISRVHAPLSGFDWSDNKLRSGRNPRDAPAEFEQVEIDFAKEEGRLALLRPQSDKNLLSGKPSTVQYDIDGEKRTQQRICGCDIPTNIRREFASPENTGPSWRREPVASDR